MAGSADQDSVNFSARCKDGHFLIVRGDGTTGRQCEEHSFAARKNLWVAVRDAVFRDARLEQRLRRAAIRRDLPQTAVVVRHEHDRASDPQSPPKKPVPDRVQMVMGDPPPTAAFCNSDPLPKAIHRLSGEKNAVSAPSVPSTGFPSVSPSARRNS